MRFGAGVAVLLLFLLALYRMRPVIPTPAVSEGAQIGREETLQGTVLAVASGPAPGAPEPSGAPGTSPATLRIRLTSGSQRGREIQLNIGGGTATVLSTSAQRYRPGDRLVLVYLPDVDSAGDDGTRDAFQIVDRVRWPWLILGVALFAATVATVARGQGARALVGLAVAICVVWWFVIPRLLIGQPPVPVSLVGCGLIAIPALVLTNGLGRSSFVPLAGIAGSLVIVGLLTTLSVNLARISGLATSEEINLLYVGTHGAVDPRGLFLAGLLIGAVGGLVDVTVGQATSVFEFHDGDPAAPRRVLFRRGMIVGRAHVTAAVHTLVLAYAGAALPLLLLFALNAASLGDIWNRELIAGEVLRSIAGSVGLAVAMPLTTWLACLACTQAAP